MIKCTIKKDINSKYYSINIYGYKGDHFNNSVYNSDDVKKFINPSLKQIIKKYKIIKFYTKYDYTTNLLKEFGIDLDGNIFYYVIPTIRGLNNYVQIDIETYENNYYTSNISNFIKSLCKKFILKLL